MRRGFINASRRVLHCISLARLIGPRWGRHAKATDLGHQPRGRSAMSINQFNKALFSSIILSSLIPVIASSRNWNETPQQAANEYGYISDRRGNHEYVTIKWVAAPIFNKESPTYSLLEQYVVISVVHAHYQPNGTASFDNVSTLEARGADGKLLTLIPKDALPPAAASLITYWETQARQSQGQVGSGTRFFVFDAGTVRACEKGKLFIPLDGETYTWNTPFPGCAPQQAAPEKLLCRGLCPLSDDQVPAPAQPPSHPAQISMKATDWTLEHSPSPSQITTDWLLRHTRPSPDTRLSHPSPDPQRGWSLSLDSLLEAEPSRPVIRLPNLEVNTIAGLKFFSYLVTTASPLLTQGHYVKLVGGISARGDVDAFSYPLGSTPGWCRMYFQEVGDDPSSTESRYLYYRWWSRDTLVLHGGRFVQVIGLEPQFWLSVAWDPGDTSAVATAGFQQALANPQQIGVMCRGAYVDGGGDDYPRRALVEPTFSMFSFAVCDPFRGAPTSDLTDAPSAKQENQACAPLHH